MLPLQGEKRQEHDAFWGEACTTILSERHCCSEMRRASKSTLFKCKAACYNTFWPTAGRCSHLLPLHEDERQGHAALLR